MLAITGLLGLTLLGGEPTKTADSSVQVNVQVRIVDLKGLDWRGPVHQGLKPAGRQGAVSFWTTDRTTADAIQDAAENTIQAPAVLVADGASTQIFNETRKNYVADLARVANGPQGKNTHLAWTPEIDSARDGISADLTCKTTADGTKITAVIDESRILAIHTYTIADSVIDSKTQKIAQKVNAQVQVPEIATCRVEGNWVVPKDGVLVISLGARSSAYEKGKATVSERVLLIEPKASRPATTGAIRASHEVLAAWVAANRSPKSKAWHPAHPATHGAANGGIVEPTPLNLPVMAAAAAPAPRAMPVLPNVLPVLASPTVAPHPGWKASVRIEARATLPSASEDGLMAYIPLSMTHLPFALPMTWLGFAIEPNRGDEPTIAMKTATPPTRNFPSIVGMSEPEPSQPFLNDDNLPPLPDSSVMIASATVYAAPQAPHVQTFKTADPTLARVAVEVGSALPFQYTDDRERFWFLDTPPYLEPFYPRSFEHAKEDVVLFPAPQAIDESDCAEHSQGRVTRKFNGIGLACGLPESLPTSAEQLAVVKRRLANLRYFATKDAAKSDNQAAPTVFMPPPVRKFDDAVIAPPDRVKTIQGSTLSFSLKGADGVCESNSEIRLKAIEAQPITIRMPMADGSIVEIQARVVTPSSR